VTQKSAWFMLHRVRVAIKTKSLNRKLSGIVDTDECHSGFIGNMHKARANKVDAGGKAIGGKRKTIL